MTVGEVKRVKKLLEGFDFCEIIETFAGQNNTYKVEILNVWQEDGIVGFYDCNNVIEQLEDTVLQGFILSSAELVMYEDQFTINLKDEKIYVKGIN